MLQPIIQGRGLNLHPAVVILAVTAGSSLAGIVGAFLAVPVAAVIAVVYRYAATRSTTVLPAPLTIGPGSATIRVSGPKRKPVAGRVRPATGQRSLRW